MAIAGKYGENIYIYGTDFSDEEFIDKIYPSISPRKLYTLSFTDIDGVVYSLEYVKGIEIPFEVFKLKRCPSFVNIDISPKYKRNFKKEI